MLQIYVYGKYLEGYLELPPDTVLQMDITYPAFDDDLLIGEFSLPLEVDFTDFNRRLLGFPELLNEQLQDEVNYWRVNVISDGVPELQDAKMTLLKTSGTFDYRRGRFSFTISGNKGLFGSLIKNKKLTDLHLGGRISWNGFSSRQFATNVMMGNITSWLYIRFGPVARENFFDADRPDYDNEFIIYDTVNYVHVYSAGNAWEFGRPKVSTPTMVALPGDAEYVDYRTVPFFQLYFVVKKIFEEHGYSITGNFFSTNYFVDLVLDNNRALEKYHVLPAKDNNREIIPSQHMPDILIRDFLVALQKRFNLKIVFREGRKVEIAFKQRINGQLQQTLSLTPIVSNQYERNNLEFQDQGFTIESNFDSTDDYPDDRIQDMKDKTIVATVKTRNDLGTLNINRTFTTEDYAYVTAENMYYQVTDAAAVPVLWEVYSERLNEIVIGKGDNSISTDMTPLCTYAVENPDTARVENRDMCGVRQKGSYINSNGIPVISDFGMRIFYCKMIKVGSVTVPKTFSHNRDFQNVKRVPYSLAWHTDDGLYKNFYEEWIKFLLNTKELQTQITVNQKWWKEVQEADRFEILGVHYVAKNLQIDLPIGKGQPLQITLYRSSFK